MCLGTIEYFPGLARFTEILLTYFIIFFLCSHFTNFGKQAFS